MNYWLWLTIIIAPALVLFIKPTAPARIRIGRLILAALVVYILSNLATHLEYKSSWDAYDDCQSQFYDIDQHHEECKVGMKGKGFVFMPLLGWIPAIAYVGLCELFWRLWHRQEIKTFGKDYRGKKVSSLFIIFAIFMFIILPSTGFIGGLIAVAIQG